MGLPGKRPCGAGALGQLYPAAAAGLFLLTVLLSGQLIGLYRISGKTEPYKGWLNYAHAFQTYAGPELAACPFCG